MRAMVLCGDKVLLVKHSYCPKWYMPGGGVDAKETGLQAVRRELEEEVGVKSEKFDLFGFYHSKQERLDDFVALYVTQVEDEEHQIDEKEIEQAGWFSFDKLPHDISPATKRRVEEYLGRAAKSDRW